MKKQLIIGGLLASSLGASSQAAWNGSGTTGNAWRSANIGIGVSSPAFALDINGVGSNDGIRVTNPSSGSGAASLYLNNLNTNGHNYLLASYGTANGQGAGNFGIYDMTAGLDRLFINGTSGNVGIGSTSSAYKLDIQTSTASDGIHIKQAGTAGACSIRLENGTSNGRQYGIHSFGTGDTYAGSFGIYDHTSAAYRLVINSNGNVAIGLGSTTCRLHAYKTATGSGDICTKSEIGNSGFNSVYGIYGLATGVGNTGTSYGVFGQATGSANNTGGTFSSIGGASGITSYGVYAQVANASAGGSNYALYANTGVSGVANTWAGYFSGDVNISGSAYCTSSAWSSDQKLKKDINLLSDGLDKIKLLKPSTYNFRVDEFKSMNLPKTPQMGLIAQDLEKVYPNLVTELAEELILDQDGKATGVIPSHKVVNYIGLIPVLISGMQEQQAQLDAQTKINADLSNQITNLQNQINAQNGNKTVGTTGIDQLSNPTDGFSLGQNIPNPFNQETVINYTLPQQSNTASMAVYDLSGKQITSYPLEKGSSSLTITSEKLAAGIYIYSVLVDGKIMDSKRMVVAQKQ